MNPLVDQLLSRMPQSNIYPADVVHEIRPKIRGRSFFPGGCGLYRGCDQTLRPRPIMLIGQDFGSLTYWNDIKGAPEEKLVDTWLNLVKLMSEVDIALTDCFLTNALLGVRMRGKIYGPSPGLKFREYVEASSQFLIEQIRIVQPSVVVALGKIPSVLLARKLGRSTLLPKASTTWSNVDGDGLQFIDAVNLSGAQTFSLATSVHPDRYWLHKKHRSWGELKGNAAHVAIWERIRQSAKATPYSK